MIQNVQKATWSLSSTVLFSSSSIDDVLREKFDKTMLSNNTRIFSSWPNFEKSLPRRKYNDERISSNLPLYKLNYYASDYDLQRFANEIMKPPKNGDQVRSWVKYITAPPSYGKTSCVLPAFLKTSFTHYFYIAFDNNGISNYKLDKPSLISHSPHRARMQGADFIFKCVKLFLDSPLPGPHIIECNSNPQDFSSLLDALKNCLADKLGDQHKCLFHLDEHHNICPGISDHDMENDFFRGVTELLINAPRVEVVATSTDLPLLPPSGSSMVCRIPIKTPILDIDQVMATVPELRISTPCNVSRRFSRKLATLKLRLGMKIQQLGIASVLHFRHESLEAESFLAAFQSAAAQIDEKEEDEEALKACMDCCRYSGEEKVISYPHAAALLLGIPEYQRSWDEYRQLTDLQLIDNGVLTTSLANLLAVVDPKVEMYGKGRTLFLSLLRAEYDDLSISPLEAAFIWTLATMSAIGKFLNFYLSCFAIECKELACARLFPGGDSSICDTAFLQQGVLYYADERNGKPTHPLADIFFITKEQQLVLVDVTAGDDKRALQKSEDLLAWIEDNGGRINGYTLHGVVLAPYDNSDSSSLKVVPNTNDESEVEIVSGVSARLLLCGLDQTFVWLEA